jgi:FlgD Ig-like domain
VKAILIIMVFMLTFVVLPAGFILNWEQYFGSAASDGANAVCETAEGGYIIAGYTCSEPDNNTDISLVCSDADGGELWIGNCNIGGWDYATGVCAAVGEPGYIVTGYSISGSESGFDGFLLKTDLSGNELWRQVYEISGFQQVEAVCAVEDDGYLLCGSGDIIGNEDDIIVLRTDTAGDTLWTQNYGCALSDTGYDIISLDDGTFLITGSTGLYDLPYPGSPGRNRELYLLKIDSSGELLMENSYWIMNTHQNSYDLGNAVCAATGGGFYAVGSTSRHLNELMDVAIIKVDNELNEVWKTHLEFAGFYDYGYDICEDPESRNIYLCGSANQSQQHEARLFVAALSAEGAILDQSLFPNWGAGSGNAILLNNAGNIVVTGYGSASIGGYSDLRLLSLTHLQSEEEEESLPQKDQSFINYPNPFNPSTTIFLESELPANQSVNFSIYNIRGELVRQFPSQQQKIFTWNGLDNSGNPVAAGIYYGCLQSQAKSSYRKMVLLK